MFSKRKLASKLQAIGLISFLFAAAIIVWTYLPIAKEEVVYQTKKVRPTNQEVQPIDSEFGLVIPKIGANAKVIENVDPFNPKEYQLALSRGVAHAKGTALPGETGNIFLFSHSSADFGLATRFNSIFYLLGKLEEGDEADIFYKGKKYIYRLDKKLIVNPEEISYLNKNSATPTLTLMTCWPPGTSLKRLLAIFTLLTPEKTTL